MMLRPVARAMRASASGSRARPRFVGSTKVWPPACLKSSASSRATFSSRSRRLSRFDAEVLAHPAEVGQADRLPGQALVAPRAFAGSLNITSKSIRRCSWGSVIPIASAGDGAEHGLGLSREDGAWHALAPPPRRSGRRWSRTCRAGRSPCRRRTAGAARGRRRRPAWCGRSRSRCWPARPRPGCRPSGRSGTAWVLIRKLSPHFLLMPGNELDVVATAAGIAVFSAPISSAPMWFWAMRSTVSRCSTWAPLCVPPFMIICANGQVVARRCRRGRRRP